LFLDEWREFFCSEYGWTLEYVDNAAILDLWNLKRYATARKIEEGFQFSQSIGMLFADDETRRDIISKAEAVIRHCKGIKLPTLEQRYKHRPDLLAKLKKK